MKGTVKNEYLISSNKSKKNAKIFTAQFPHVNVRFSSNLTHTRTLSPWFVAWETCDWSHSCQHEGAVRLRSKMLEVGDVREMRSDCIHSFIHSSHIYWASIGVRYESWRWWRKDKCGPGVKELTLQGNDSRAALGKAGMGGPDLDQPSNTCPTSTRASKDLRAVTNVICKLMDYSRGGECPARRPYLVWPNQGIASRTGNSIYLGAFSIVNI